MGRIARLLEHDRYPPLAGLDTLNSTNTIIDRCSEGFGPLFLPGDLGQTDQTKSGQLLYIAQCSRSVVGWKRRKEGRNKNSAALALNVVVAGRPTVARGL